jgi:histidinol-phosphatase (PHP family)
MIKYYKGCGFMLKNNYHTHTYLCRHAEGKVMDYAKAAYENGFLELGMSDHAPVLKDFMREEEYLRNHLDTGAMDISELDLYFKQIEEAKIAYPDLKIYSGFETEYLEEQYDFYKSLRKRVDYFNLGIHFFKDKNGNVLNCYTELDYSNLDEYYNNAKMALSTGMYTTFVHPDIFMFGYKDINGNHVFDQKCEEITRKIAELALKYDIYLEVNTNGLKYCKDKQDRSTWLYPYPKFWEIIKEYPVKILVGADAHTVDALYNENVRLVFDFIHELGLKIEEKMVIKNDEKL